MKRFKSLRQVQRFLSSHGLISNLFHLPHGYVSAVQYWAARAHVFERWVEVSGVAAAAWALHDQGRLPSSIVVQGQQVDCAFPGVEYVATRAH